MNRIALEEKEAREKVLLEQIEYLTKKLFGSSSEARSKEIPGQLNLFDEAETEQKPSVLGQEEKKVVKTHERKAKASHKDVFKGLPVEKVVMPLPDEEKICPECGTERKKIGVLRRSPTCGFSAAEKMVCRPSFCMDILQHETVTMRKNSWMGSMDIWKQMDTRDTINCRISNDAPVGLIFADTSSMRFPKERHMIIPNRLYRVCSIAIACSQSRMKSTGSIPVIMKNANSFVSRRKNRFLRLFGRGLISSVR